MGLSIGLIVFERVTEGVGVGVAVRLEVLEVVLPPLMAKVLVGLGVLVGLLLEGRTQTDV